MTSYCCSWARRLVQANGPLGQGVTADGCMEDFTGWTPCVVARPLKNQQVALLSPCILTLIEQWYEQVIRWREGSMEAMRRFARGRSTSESSLCYLLWHTVNGVNSL